MATFDNTLANPANGSLQIAHPQKISLQNIASLARLAKPDNSGLPAQGRFPGEACATRDELPDSRQRDSSRLHRRRFRIIRRQPARYQICIHKFPLLSLIRQIAIGEGGLAHPVRPGDDKQRRHRQFRSASLHLSTTPSLQSSNIEIPHIQRVILDKLAARFDLFAH